MSNNQDILDLFDSAVKDDGLDADTSMILVDNLDTVALAGCMGADLDQIGTDDVTLVAVVLDQSGSMSGSRQAVIAGYNAMLDALADSRQADSILLSTWKFDTTSQLIFSYTPITQAGNLTENQFNPDGGTALYDTLLYVATGLVAYGQNLRNNGVRTKCVIVVFSDGDDNSSNASAQQVRTVSNGLLAQEIYSLAYVGFGGSDLRQIADAIGFPSIITASTTPSEIRRIFQQVSQSVLRASQMTVGAGNSFFI